MRAHDRHGPKRHNAIDDIVLLEQLTAKLHRRWKGLWLERSELRTQLVQEARACLWVEVWALAKRGNRVEWGGYHWMEGILQ